MSTYCVTFRIANRTVNGQTYADRYNQMIDNVRGNGMGYWEETTSFFLAESALNTEAFAKHASDGLSSAHDLLVAFDPADMSAAYFGKLEHPAVLRSFFRDLRKVP